MKHVSRAGARSFWMRRSVRERRMLMVLGGVLAVVGFLQGLWAPVERLTARLRPLVVQLETEQALMDELLNEARQLRARPALARLAPDVLEARLREAAQTQSFPLDGWSVRAEGDNLALSGAADFDQWLRLAGILEARYQLRLRQLQIRTGNESGQVMVVAELAGGGEDG